MPKLTIHVLTYEGYDYALPETEDVSAFPPEMVRAYIFERSTYDSNKAIEVGRLLNNAGLFNANGLADADALAVARGKFVASQTLTGWDRQTDDGKDLPRSLENIGTLPPCVLSAYGERVAQRPGLTVKTLAEIKAARDAEKK